MLHLIETPETSTLRLNADAISYLGNAFNEAEDIDIKLIDFEAYKVEQILIYI